MNKTVLGCIVLLLVVGLLAGVWLTGLYNGLVGQDEAVKKAWGNVENVYQRRADLIPNLVATVKGSATFEQETLQNVIEARSRVGQVSGAALQGVLDSPERFAQFQAAQDGLSSALSRLMVVVERYPELKTTAAFQDLMVQLEGTENRITVERNRFNEVAQGFNTALRRFPTGAVVRLLGWPFAERPYFQAQAGAETAPRVEF
ncbi:MAG TPA: LemA family protein [Thermoanaerobaculia bacterium]|jgi:LemA protein|nr:LemA family protein [Thermoanaerobaculia bacterium]